jgi:UDP-2,4-diacetamido-2,4,6-trideoxy-beta-L-altropyranose hydrolase
MKKVLFRADASADIGYGHFIRSLALADMLKENFDCCLVTVNPTEYQIREIEKVCKYLSLSEINHFDVFLSLLKGDEIVVLDNYFFTTDYQREIKKRGCKLVCMDDMHDKHYVADVVINYAVGVTKADYSVEPYTQLCLGLSYALLRKPFLTKHVKGKHNGINVFICFGGSDINNLTCRCVKAIKFLNEISIINVIIGDAYSSILELRNLREQDERISILSNLPAEDMAQLLNETDIAVLPASSVLWEALFVGVDNIIYGYYVDNQKDICNHLRDNDCLGLSYIGNFNSLDVTLLRQKIYDRIVFINKRRKLTYNIFNNKNVIKNINQLFNSRINIREADEKDMMLYYNWINDPIVRESAFNSEYVSLEEHINWFNNKLKNPCSFLYLCYYNNIPIGQVRYDVNDFKAEVDLSIDKEFRGKGLSVDMLLSSMQYLHNNLGVSIFISQVKKENTPSQYMFLKAGFSFQKSINEDTYLFSHNIIKC